MLQNKLHCFFFTCFTVTLNLTRMNKSKYALKESQKILGIVLKWRHHANGLVLQ